MSAKPFTAFSEELFTFLDELQANNHRDWFEANKDRYEAHVREPARAFIRAMAPRITRVTDSLIADDRKAGGSLMRIFRDTRFANDKTPYKTNVGIQFRHRGGKDVHAPGLYVHLATDEIFVGVGVWRPPTEAIRAIRAHIDAEQDRWTEIVTDSRFTDLLTRGGESLSRAPKGYAKDHPLLAEINRKDHLAMRTLTRADALSDDLPDQVEDVLMASHDYAKFICDAIGVSF